MGQRSTPEIAAINYGYLSPQLRGRADLDFFNQSCDYLKNYEVTAQGEGQFRYGSRFVSNTRNNAKARLIPFIFETSDTYVIEITEDFMRFYRNNGIITLTPQSITGITQADPAVVTYAGADTYANGDRVILSGVAGMHQVNGREFIVANVNTGTNTFELQTVDAVDLDSTGYDAYVSGGEVAEIYEISSPYQESELETIDYTQTNNTVYIVHPNHAPRKLTRSSSTSWTLATFSRTSDPFTGAGDFPSTVTLFEGRIWYCATDDEPLALWASKSGDLDNFTTGTNDDDALKFTLRSDQANRIRFIIGAEEYMALGTSGSEFRISGGGDNNAITPTNISIKPSSFNGVAAIRPIRLDSYVVYIQRNRKTVRTFEYNALRDGYTSPDRTLLANHIGKSGMTEMAFTSGSPNIVWIVRNDGRMVGMTFDPEQQVVAWHMHDTDGEFESITKIPEADGDDELWLSVKRTVNGQTVRYVEYIPNKPVIPVPEDYFTGQDNEESDMSAYLSALWNVQRTLVHCDASLVYDGRLLTTGINLTITGDLTIGETVTVTASGSFFTADMATNNRRIQSPNGGQIQITAFTSATVVTGTVIYDIESSTLTGGEWAYMAQSVSGLWHMEGKDVAILADGGVIEGRTVQNGIVSLDDDAGYVIVGLKYVGIGKTQEILGGERIGRSMTKQRNITNIKVKFRASLGTKFGTSLYNLEEPPYREFGEVAGRPPRLVDGVIQIETPDSWDNIKHVYWLHDTPTPSNIQYIQPLMETNEE